MQDKKGENMGGRRIREERVQDQKGENKGGCNIREIRGGCRIREERIGKGAGSLIFRLFKSILFFVNCISLYSLRLL